MSVVIKAECTRIAQHEEDKSGESAKVTFSSRDYGFIHIRFPKEEARGFEFGERYTITIKKDD